MTLCAELTEAIRPNPEGGLRAIERPRADARAPRLGKGVLRRDRACRKDLAQDVCGLIECRAVSGGRRLCEELGCRSS